jgi:hypothetical protein
MTATFMIRHNAASHGMRTADECVPGLPMPSKLALPYPVSQFVDNLCGG